MCENLNQNDIEPEKKVSTTNGLVTARDSQSILAQRLAFKAFEIEESADIYFFRPLGFIVARCAGAIGATPTQLTLLSMLAGVAGGALLYSERLGLLGFALLITYSIFDSADGQLARMTGRVTDLGRILDGVSGYITHAAIYIALTAGLLHAGSTENIVIWAALAAIANTLQAQMYEYHWHRYAMIAAKGLVPRDDLTTNASRWTSWLYRWHLGTQRMLNQPHVEVESVIAARSTAGAVREDDRARYRDCFSQPMRGWNLLGDNTRLFAIGVLLCLHRIDLFFPFIVIPMNLVLIIVWFWQRNADRKFLAAS